MTRRIGFLGLTALILLAAPALAHPHVWVTSRAEILYAPDGRITAVRHSWTFDKAYSSFITQGLDTDKNGKLSPEELAPLAKENTESLVDYEYFTVLKANGAKQAFDAPRDYGMAYANEEVTLSYVLPLRTPSHANRMLTLEVSDPTYFVAFTMAEGDAVKLAGAPKGCAASISRPKPVDSAQQQNLSEAFFQGLSASSNFGAQFANRAIVACP
jgi:ABC-type uncharacterized transport system substrate-binding protein